MILCLDLNCQEPVISMFKPFFPFSYFKYDKYQYHSNGLPYTYKVNTPPNGEINEHNFDNPN